jgi:hypothetical protein
MEKPFHCFTHRFVAFTEKDFEMRKHCLYLMSHQKNNSHEKIFTPPFNQYFFSRQGAELSAERM